MANLILCWSCNLKTFRAGTLEVRPEVRLKLEPRVSLSGSSGDHPSPVPGTLAVFGSTCRPSFQNYPNENELNGLHAASKLVSRDTLPKQAQPSTPVCAKIRKVMHHEKRSSSRLPLDARRAHWRWESSNRLLGCMLIKTNRFRFCCPSRARAPPGCCFLLPFATPSRRSPSLRTEGEITLR